LCAEGWWWEEEKPLRLAFGAREGWWWPRRWWWWAKRTLRLAFGAREGGGKVFPFSEEGWPLLAIFKNIILYLYYDLHIDYSRHPI
jgi:hypothetical protein